MKPPTPRSMPQGERVAGYLLTRHARERMAQMEVTAAQVAEVLSNPDDTWAQQEKFGPDARAYAKGNYGVCVDDKKKVVVTVVWRSKAVWKQRLAMGHDR